jgi:hypothetical protein
MEPSAESQLVSLQRQPLTVFDQSEPVEIVLGKERVEVLPLRALRDLFTAVVEALGSTEHRLDQCLATGSVDSAPPGAGWRSNTALEELVERVQVRGRRPWPS